MKRWHTLGTWIGDTGEESSKSQVPSSREAPNPKFQGSWCQCFSSASPIVMHLVTDLLFIDSVNGVQRLPGERRQLRRGSVFLHLRHSLGAWDGARYCRKHQNPAKRQLGQVCPRRYQRPQRFHGLEAGLVIQTRKGFPTIECLALPVECAMVLALEGARRSEFAGQHPGRKRQAGQNSDATPLG